MPQTSSAYRWRPIGSAYGGDRPYTDRFVRTAHRPGNGPADATVWRPAATSGRSPTTLRASIHVEGLDFCEREWCEPLIFMLDPRSYGEVRFGADVLWREAGFEAWLPDWLTGD